MHTGREHLILCMPSWDIPGSMLIKLVCHQYRFPSPIKEIFGLFLKRVIRSKTRAAIVTKNSRRII